MIVVDAGAFVELLLRSGSGLRVERLLRNSRGAAPCLLDAEVLQRLLRLEKHGHLSPFETDQRLERLRDAPIRRFSNRELLEPARIYGQALSGYDALYVALAAALGVELVTTDAWLARTAVAQFGLTVTAVAATPR